MATEKYRDWFEVDFSKSTKTLAEELGVGKSYVSLQRKRHAPETLLKRSKKWREAVGRINWADVDWSKQNKELAKELGCDPSYVSHNRAHLAPETMKVERRWEACDWENLTDEEIAKKFNASPGTVFSYRKKYAGHTIPEWKRRGLKRDWFSIDWSQSTTEIARKTGTTIYNVSHARRKYAPDTVKAEFDPKKRKT